MMGVGGCDGGCWPLPIPLGIVGPPSGPSLWGLGVTERSSPEAAELLETVDCCEASSTTGLPSGPMEGGLLLLRAVEGAEAWSAESSGAPEGVRGCGVEVGGGMLFWGLSRLLFGPPGGRPAIPGPLGYIWGPV